VISAERVLEALARAVSATGGAAPPILFFATFVEYVFPPFPGDAVVLLGAWYAVQGELSWPLTFVSVTAGAIAGAWVDHRVGVALGRRLDARALRRGTLSVERLARFEASYRRWGAWLLVANRFMPGVRAFLFVAAGASGIPLRRVLLYGGISAALWNVVLLAAGGLVAENQAELLALSRRYTTGAVAVGAAILALVLLGVVVRRRRAARARRAGPEAP
jgi:membrane protein DedA with SNARE-associated domain